MHFVRRDYVFFYDKGIVCYKSTPVSIKKTIKHDEAPKEQIIENDLKIEPDNGKISLTDEQQITLVPPKSLDLIESFLEEDSSVPTEKDEKQKQVRPEIVLNTLYSLVYPESSTGNSHTIHNKNDKPRVKQAGGEPSYKIPKIINENKNKTECKKCTFTNIFDIEADIYNCPETVNEYRTLDLYIRKYNVNNNQYIDNYDLYPDYNNRVEARKKNKDNDYEISFSYNKLENDLVLGQDSISNGYKSEDCREQSVELGAKTLFQSPVGLKSIDLVEPISNKDLDVYSRNTSLVEELIVNGKIVSRRGSGITRVLTNEEICEVIESPNVIRSVASFNQELSRLSSNKSIRSDSNVFTRDLISQESNDAFVYPVEHKLTKLSNVSGIKSENSQFTLENDGIKAVVPDDDTGRIDSIETDVSVENIDKSSIVHTSDVSDDDGSKEYKINECDSYNTQDEEESDLQEPGSDNIELESHSIDEIPIEHEISDENNIPIDNVHDKNDESDDEQSSNVEELEMGDEDEVCEMDEGEVQDILVEENNKEDESPDTVMDEEADEPEQVEKQEQDVDQAPIQHSEKNSEEDMPYEPYDPNQKIIRPLKNTKSNILTKGFRATVYIVNSNKTATSSLCTIMFNYEEDLLIIKSSTDIFEIKADNLTSEEIPTSPGSPILLKITMSNNQFSAIVIQCDVGKNLEILAGTIGWVNNRRKNQFKDKAPRMNIRKSLFAGLKNNRRMDKINKKQEDGNVKRAEIDNKTKLVNNSVDKKDATEEKGQMRVKGLFCRIRRKRDTANKAK